MERKRITISTQWQWQSTKEESSKRKSRGGESDWSFSQGAAQSTKNKTLT